LDKLKKKNFTFQEKKSLVPLKKKTFFQSRKKWSAAKQGRTSASPWDPKPR
jgi:hypothetical protein